VTGADGATSEPIMSSREPLAGRIAGAPISWGVCEVPGWGHQLGAERVLTEMADLGLAAAELGPDGFLPTVPEEAAALLRKHGLACVGGFMPVRLHADGDARGGVTDPVAAEIAGRIRQLRRSGASTMVLAADTGHDSYDDRPELDAHGWDRLLARLDHANESAAAAGITATLHPHMGTLVQTAAEVQRVLSGCGIGLCLDTGHMFVGGADVHEVARTSPDRVAHVHLKDVDAGLAADVRDGRLAYATAVRQGLYTPLGQGAVGIGDLVVALERAGYSGWYVLEQDTVLDAEPIEGGGPAVQVRESLDYLAGIASLRAGQTAARSPA
jgi:inosose dehydratase